MLILLTREDLKREAQRRYDDLQQSSIALDDVSLGTPLFTDLGIEGTVILLAPEKQKFRILRQPGRPGYTQTLPWGLLAQRINVYARAETTANEKLEEYKCQDSNANSDSGEDSLGPVSDSPERSME